MRRVENGVPTLVFAAALGMLTACGPDLAGGGAATGPAAMPSRMAPSEEAARKHRPAHAVAVGAELGWVESGRHLSPGQRLVIAVTGEVNTNGGIPSSTSGPDGQAYPCSVQAGSSCLLDDAPYGALVGRIGGGEAFLVGASLKTVSLVGGKLLLGVNDNQAFLADNTGAFSAVILVRRPHRDSGEADD